MKFALLLFGLAALAAAQITVTPPTPPVPPTPGSPGMPGKIVAVAGRLSCTINGDASPALAVLVSCTAGATTTGPFTVPVPSNTSWTFDQHVGSSPVTTPPTADMITCTFSGTQAMGVRFDCVATAIGQPEQKASGVL